MNIVEYSGAHRHLCIEMFASNTPAFFAPVEQPLFESWLTDIENGSGRKGGTLYNYVAFEHEAPVACAGFHISPGNLQATMAWGMVHRAWHRKGIGRALLNFRIARIRQMFPASPIALDTTQFSVGFYEKHGFVVTGVIKDFYAPGMDRFDMELRADNITL